MTPVPETLWHATAAAIPPFPPLAGGAEADLLVVGGGFTGLSAALHAAEAGLRVVLVEAEGIAFGATGRNAGFVVPNFAKVDPDDVRAKLGEPRAARLLAMAAGSADLVFALIRRHGIACEALQSGWIQPSHSDAALARARERVRQWQALDRPAELLDAEAVQALTGVRGWRGGWIDRSGGVLNPVAYARGLALAAAAAGAAIHEGTPVTALEREGQGWRAATPGGDIRATKVLLATNAHAGGLWPRLARSFFPLKVFQIATEPLAPSVRDRLLPGGQCVSDSRRNLFTFRFDAGNRLITGGMHILGPGAATRVPRAILARMARALDLPEAPRLQFSWSGMAAVTPDFLPRLIEPAPGLLAAFACNARGIALTTALGPELARWAAGEPADNLAPPLAPLRAIPFHGLARMAPNALLPLSILRDRRESPPGLAR
ncbi:FAD-binding oxidoreductase [Rhodobacter sp. SGA-6-6]|uniref:NAD(P)/FAD-dependent oxidoreductase n=1 Tax=Rhodobacter sp. SGA-6-6 TaxID=2710882 RepID=UPI0013EA9CC5|nr:FAD-binding oxidoreductase [Rhodobacter sp. SGA-6-6]NGM46245.1 FAD-binding oxidoreductase [Rhodobacter sp. SGA-6-6]